MVNAGLLPGTVTTATKSQTWSQVLPHLSVPIRTWSSPAESKPSLGGAEEQSTTQATAGCLHHAAGCGNFFRQYSAAPLPAEHQVGCKCNSPSPEELKKFQTLITFFQKYAAEYDFDYLMIAAQGYQESLLNQNMRSPGGAVGIMQVIPKNAAASPINVPNVNYGARQHRGGSQDAA